ncbi:prolactin-8A6-like isoform X3 [Arvicanthis niloticus]|uniref:prolactin-8A6-like isoform X3 n=1 Tax=Arvicanthis niloticus TaxID=61156 RepID=UPI0014875162|nr:prolactin-8A6-like isoform X3 [Arvicanthis niloticus]
MEMLLSLPTFSGTLLVLVVSNLLLCEKAASIPACMAEEGGCWNPLVETFNSAIQKAESLHNFADQLYVELHYSKFSSGHFASLIAPYLKTLINFVGSWISPLFHLVIELSAMKDVPETILSKVKEIELKNREILDDLRWILTKVSPIEEMEEKFPSWEHLSFLKSSNKNNKFLAMFNLSYCLDYDTKYLLLQLKMLKCLITGKDC